MTLPNLQKSKTFFLQFLLNPEETFSDLKELLTQKDVCYFHYMLKAQELGVEAPKQSRYIWDLLESLGFKEEYVTFSSLDLIYTKPKPS